MRTRAQWLRQARSHRLLTHASVAALIVVIVAGVSVLGRGDRQTPAGRREAAADRPDAADGSAASTVPGGANLVRVDVFPTKDGKPVRDLTAADFDVLEDGNPQKVESFEHVEISGQIPQEERREPNTVREARAMAEDPRSRIFIIFLDTYHTEVAGSHRMQTVLEHLLDRIIGPDDLFGVMTPEMSATDITLSRRTETTEGFLHKYWYWGRRDQLADRDPVEAMYRVVLSGKRHAYVSGPERSHRQQDDRRAEHLSLRRARDDSASSRETRARCAQRISASTCRDCAKSEKP